MNKKRLLTLFGLKWNPFLPNIPVQSLWSSPGIDTFLFQIENLVMDGGFALMCVEPGLGKSKNLQYLAHHLERLENVVVGIIERPQSSLADFYREMGDLFGVNLTYDKAFSNIVIEDSTFMNSRGVKLRNTML